MTNFRDTLLIFAASLGRVAIAQHLSNGMVNSHRFHAGTKLLQIFYTMKSPEETSSTDFSYTGSPLTAFVQAVR